MTKWTRVAALAAVALLVVSGAFAQTSGRIEGTVQDSNGAALPGVTLTATSSTLPGSVTAVTDGAGNFRLLSLPPGNYTVAAALEGFNNIEQRDILTILCQRWILSAVNLPAGFRAICPQHVQAIGQISEHRAIAHHGRGEAVTFVQHLNVINAGDTP